MVGSAGISSLESPGKDNLAERNGEDTSGFGVYSKRVSYFVHFLDANDSDESIG